MKDPNEKRPEDGASVKWTDKAGEEHTGHYDQENDVFYGETEEGKTGTTEWDFREHAAEWEEL